MRTKTAWTGLVLVIMAGAPLACGGGSAPAGSANETGGTTGTGGGSSAGGLSSTGGSTASGGQSSSGGSPVTSVPGSTVLSSLTPAQAATVCEESRAYLEPKMLEPMCTAVGALAAVEATDADPIATCESTRDACISDGLANDCETTDTSECTATIDEVNQCYQDLAAMFGNVEASCEQGAAAFVALAPLLQTPATCQTLTAKCPELAPNTAVLE